MVDPSFVFDCVGQIAVANRSEKDQSSREYKKGQKINDIRSATGSEEPDHQPTSRLGNKPSTGNRSNESLALTNVECLPSTALRFTPKRQRYTSAQTGSKKIRIAPGKRVSPIAEKSVIAALKRSVARRKDLKSSHSSTFIKARVTREPAKATAI